MNVCAYTIHPMMCVCVFVDYVSPVDEVEEEEDLDQTLNTWLHHQEDRSYTHTNESPPTHKEPHFRVRTSGTAEGHGSSGGDEDPIEEELSIVQIPHPDHVNENDSVISDGSGYNNYGQDDSQDFEDPEVSDLQCMLANELMHR